jgi:hypothetical protein
MPWRTAHNIQYNTAYAIAFRVATGTHGSAEDWRRDIKRRLLWHQATIPRFALAQAILMPFLHTASDVLSLLPFVLQYHSCLPSAACVAVVCRGNRLADCLHLKTKGHRVEDQGSATDFRLMSALVALREASNVVAVPVALLSRFALSFCCV